MNCWHNAAFVKLPTELRIPRISCIPPRQNSTLLLVYRARTANKHYMYMKCALRISKLTPGRDCARTHIMQVCYTNECALRALNSDFVIVECIGSSYIAQQRHHHLEKNQGQSLTDQPNSLLFISCRCVYVYEFLLYIYVHALWRFTVNVWVSLVAAGGCVIL